MTSFELVKDGLPNATIIIGDDAKEIQVLAAKQISDYFKRFTNVELSIRKCSEVKKRLKGNLVLLGTPESNPLLGEVVQSESLLKENDLGKEGYLIKTVEQYKNEKKCLLIAGQEEIGAFYGTVYFLDFLVKIDGMNAIVKKLDIKRKPALKMRGTYTLAMRMPYYDLSAWKRIIDDMAKGAMNTLYFWFAGAFRSRKFPETIIGEYSGHKYMQVGNRFYGTVMSDEDIHELIKYAHTRGVKFYLGSGVFGWDGINKVIQTNTALTNQAQWQLMREYLVEMMDVYPEADGLFLEIADEYAQWEGSIKEAGRLELKFLRELGESVWKQHPEAQLIWCIGYPNHSENPDYYEEIKEITDRRILFLSTRLGGWYRSPSGEQLSFSDPTVLGNISKRHCIWNHFMRQSVSDIQKVCQIAQKAGILGYTPAREFQLFYLPSGNPYLYGWYSLAAPSMDNFPTESLPIEINTVIFRELCWNPYISMENLKDKLHRKFLGSKIPGEFVDELLYIQELYRKIHYGKLGQDAVSFRQRGGKVDTVEQWRKTGTVPEDYSQFFTDIEQARKRYLPRLEEMEREVKKYLFNSSKKSKFTFSRIKRFINDCKKNLFFVDNIKR